jgi:GT2 family glycosyltransferase
LAELTKAEFRRPSFGSVVINWNGPSDTIACLESLWLAEPGVARVVVVDNASTDNSLDAIQDWARLKGVPMTLMRGGVARRPDTWLTIIAASTNRGFAGGNNVGLDYLRETDDLSHFLLLNNDATVAEDFFAEIGRALASRPEAGLVTGTIYEHPAREKVWYAGGREIRSRALIVHNTEVPSGRAPIETEFVSGCVMLISREALDRVGSLAECYFPLYMEDAEYSLRVRKAGLPVLYAPTVKAYHKVGATVGKAETSPFITRAQIRHRILYVRRNFPPLQRAAALAYLAATKPAKALLETVSGRPGIGWAVLRGTIEGFAART